ncbi:MAG: hypothetical protein QNJ94_07470 [Alphaproteobacteria bacterium]|nr:hypothetical protein [Alphaproteobacteria bacterium]
MARKMDEANQLMARNCDRRRGLRVIDPHAVRRRGIAARPLSLSRPAGPASPRPTLVPPSVSNGSVETQLRRGRDLVDLDELPKPGDD